MNSLIIFLTSYVIFPIIILNSFLEVAYLPLYLAVSLEFLIIPSLGTELAAFFMLINFYNVVFVLATVELWFLLLLFTPLMEKPRDFFKL